MRIHHSAPYDPAGLINHAHRRPLETNVQSCKHPHRCSPSFARGITSGKGRLPAGEQQPHVWDVLAYYFLMLPVARQADLGLKENGQHRRANCAAAIAMEDAIEKRTPFRVLKQP